jgi:MFS family permease
VIINRTLDTKLPTSVFILGLVSLLMDLSSETIHVLLPLFMIQTLALSPLMVGVLDGASEVVTLCVKPLAGWLSDRSGKRKPLAVAGYGLSALSKPLFALATGLGWLVPARFLDRAGKGLRGAPRDALIADITHHSQRGAAYGLRQSLDTIGALAAPFAASALIFIFLNDFRAVFWVATIPAVLSVLLLCVGVKEPDITEQKKSVDVIKEKLPASYWWVVALALLIALARPSEAFLVLRAQTLGLSNVEAPLVMAAMNMVYALTAFPIGKFFDRKGAATLLPLSLVFLSIGLLMLALTTEPIWMFVGAGLWGLHLGLSQGVISALISQRAPVSRRAMAFGIYAVVIGMALLMNGALVGSLWQYINPTAALLVASAIALTALIMAPFFLKAAHISN